MNTCTYDNPATMHRECWVDGKLKCSYSFKLFFQKEPIPGEYFFFGANVGDWKTGQLFGDIKAMEKSS